MTSRIRRTAHIAVIADEVLSYREVGIITVQLIDCMHIGLLRNVDDPNIIWDVLSEVTEAAQAQLAPLGFGLTWVLSDE
jgi:hypothetical protein